MKPSVINASRQRHSRRGSVVLILLAYLVLMTMLCTATWRTVYWTRHEVSLIEKHQIARLTPTTNTPSASLTTTNTP